MRKITKTQLLAMVKKSDKPIAVKIISSNLYPSGGWTQGFDIEVEYNEDRGMYVVGQYTMELINGVYTDLPQMLNTWLDGWAYYNTDSERGYYAHYYVKA